MSEMLDSLVDHSFASDVDGIAFSERYFVAVLRNGVDWFIANPLAWRGILGNVTDQELTNFVAYFSNRRPVVRLGYARAKDPLPQINVILESETGSESFVGDLAGLGTISELTTDGAINSDIRKQRVSLHVHSDHAEIVLYLYHMAHSVIMSSARFFAQKGLINLSFASGAEVYPQEVYLPETIFTRALSYEFEGVSRAVLPLPPPPANLHIYVANVVVSDTVTGGVVPI